MARAKKTDAPDLGEAHELTAGLIDRLTCPAGKLQAFMRDTKAPGLRVRATPASAKNPDGVKAFVFEAKLNRQTIRRTIGDVRAWTIEAARNEANRLRVTLDAGTDPRELERQQEAAKAASKAARTVQTVTAGEAWAAYLVARRKHWGERHYRDHIDLSAAGGIERKRGEGVTVPGALYSLLALPLRDLTPEQVQKWAEREGATRPTQARLAWRLLRAFLSWCNAENAYAPALAGVNAAKNQKARETLGKPRVKKDALLKEQLSAWFDAVQKLPNPVTTAYLQTLLLTGARPGEIMDIRWHDLNLQWRGLTIKDKVEGERVIPLTPYVSHLLAALPRRNAWVFSSARTGTHIKVPHQPHASACKVAGIDGLTHHGLRRSFKSLTEWLEIPAGVVAQLMGHKPSATAEKHYTVRPLDLLRVHHEKIEAWILQQAGIAFDAKAEPAKLQLVAG